MKIRGSVWRLRCPAELQWARLVANLVDDREANRLLRHAAECHSCSTTLKDAIFLLREEEGALPSSPETGVEYEARIPALARWTAEHARESSRFREAVVRLAALARNPRMIAAMGAVAAGLVLFAFWPQSPPLSNLASAYSTLRTVELRVPGASYAQPRITRSTLPTNLPPELLESQARIQRYLARKQNDPAWLHAWGRVQVLTWQFDPAIQTFQAAAAAGASSPEFLIDFATAYFQRGEVRRNADEYGKAVALLSSVLEHRPRDAVALFNRGLVYSRLSQTDAAIRDLELCIQAENDSGWKQEARRRVNELRQRNGR
jgi:tetratricopeptide (TPR) repeat protein